MGIHHQHGSDHQGHHHHHHAHGQSLERIGQAFWLNVVFTVIELIGGAMTNSVAILADAVHDLGDSLALAFAWYMEKQSRSDFDRESFTYGMRRLSVLSAIVTGLVLVFGSFLVLIKSVPRVLQPEPASTQGMIGLALLGVVVNGVAALRVQKGTSLNERMLMWHLLEDVFGWLMILVGAIVMNFVDLPILDPLMAIALSLWVLWNVVNNLRESLEVFLQRTPRRMKLENVQEFVRSFPSIESLHHTHLWSLDGEHHIFTGHLVVHQDVQIQDLALLRQEIKVGLQQHFHITEATLEIEWPGQQCWDPEHKA